MEYADINQTEDPTFQFSSRIQHPAILLSRNQTFSENSSSLSRCDPSRQQSENVERPEFQFSNQNCEDSFYIQPPDLSTEQKIYAGKIIGEVSDNIFAAKQEQKKILNENFNYQNPNKASKIYGSAVRSRGWPFEQNRTNSKQTYNQRAGRHLNDRDNKKQKTRKTDISGSVFRDKHQQSTKTSTSSNNSTSSLTRKNTGSILGSVFGNKPSAHSLRSKYVDQSSSNISRSIRRPKTSSYQIYSSRESKR